MRDFEPLDLPYNEDDDHVYIHNRKFNITIVVEKKAKDETNNSFINRVNNEINRRFDEFEEKVKEWNRFNSLSREEKERKIISEYNRYNHWSAMPLFKSLKPCQKKNIIEENILYYSQIPKL